MQFWRPNLIVFKLVVPVCQIISKAHRFKDPFPNMKTVTVGPLQIAGHFTYFSDNSPSPVVHMDPHVFDLEGLGHDVVLFAGLETQPNTPETFSNLKMQLFGWKAGVFRNITDIWFPGGINQVEGVGDIAIGDFNGNGLIDLFITGYADMLHTVNAYAFMNRGGYFERVKLGANDGWQHGAAAADINQDGYTDIFAVGYGSSTTLFMGGPEGLRPIPLHNDHGGGSGLALGDFLNDGTITATVVDTSGAPVKTDDTMLFRFDFADQVASSATLVPITTLPRPRLENSHPRLGSHDVRVKAVDFNHDGLLDAIVLSSSGHDGVTWHNYSAIQFLKNTGDGVFVDVTDSLLVGYNINAMIPYAPQIRDFDRDGLVDLYLDGPTFDRPRESTAFLMQSPDGRFIDTARGLLSPLTPLDGSMSTVAFGPDGQLHYIKLTSEFAPNRPATVSIARIDFPDRFKSEVLHGSSQDDQIWGIGGNNTFVGSAGNDLLIGANGIDTVTFAASKSHFSVTSTSVFDPKTQQTIGGFNIEDLTGFYGNNALAYIERIQFSDASIALDIDGKAGQAYRIYKAAFDRAPDLPGLGFWISAMDQGTPLTDVAGGFIASLEFQSRYGNTSNADFVRLLYENVLDRQPEPEGNQYWLNEMANGMSHEMVLVNFSESAENKVNVAGLIANGIEYTPFIA